MARNLARAECFRGATCTIGAGSYSEPKKLSWTLVTSREEISSKTLYGTSVFLFERFSVGRNRGKRKHSDPFLFAVNDKGRYHSVMLVNISVKKVRVKGEDRFIIMAEGERHKANDPFMSTSDLGNPPTKEEAIDKLREMEVAENDIERLIASAESPSA